MCLHCVLCRDRHGFLSMLQPTDGPEFRVGVVSTKVGGVCSPELRRFIEKVGASIVWHPSLVVKPCSIEVQGLRFVPQSILVVLVFSTQICNCVMEWRPYCLAGTAVCE